MYCSTTVIYASPPSAWRSWHQPVSVVLSDTVVALTVCIVCNAAIRSQSIVSLLRLSLMLQDVGVAKLVCCCSLKLVRVFDSVPDLLSFLTTVSTWASLMNASL
ncbi:unnamed protein product [Ascophyllum nodosum]